LIPIALAAFLLKVIMALSTYGSTDVLLFETDLTKIRHDGAVALYRDGISTRWCGHGEQLPCPPFIHPPFVIHALEGWGFLSRISGLPMRVWLRFTCALADLGSVFLVLGIVRKFRPTWSAGPALVVMALCPISVLVSGFHGNTDPIMMFLVLLSVYLIETGAPVIAAGGALGASTSIKLVPLILLPALLLHLRSFRQRTAFLGAAAAVFVIGGLPFVAQSPALVFGRVFGYEPQMGPWGLGRIAVVVGGQHEWADHLSGALKLLALGSTVAVSLWMRKSHPGTPLFVQCGFVMSVFLALTPGFGVQYLSWLVPWAVALGIYGMVAFYLVSTAFMFTYYTVGSGGFPWYFANTLERPPWHGTVILLGFICWVVVVITAGLYYQTVRKHRSLPLIG
jgi:hypothetical protein